MKTLLLIRHAEAVSKKTDIPDFERPLKNKGEKNAHRIARKLSKSKISPALLISSPANRALETAHIFAAELEYPIERILLKQEIYDAEDGGTLSQVMASLPSDRESAALFGHDPSLSEFVGLLIPEFVGPLPKGGIVGVELDTSSWSEISSCRKKVVLLHFPITKDETDNALKELRNGLRKEISQNILDYLSRFDENIAGSLGKEINKAVSRPTDLFLKKMRKKDLLQIYWRNTAFNQPSAAETGTTKQTQDE